MNDFLYKAIKQSKIEIKYAVEVGVHYPETSNLLLFIKDGVRASLVEPDPLCVEKIVEFFKEHSNVDVKPYAVYDKNDRLTLYRTNASTFVSELTQSPALVNDKYKPKEEDKFTVDALTFDKIDDGSIELLSVDTEGCEWHVVKFMKSRPKVVSLETHCKKYKNPYLKDINKWMEENGYIVWYKYWSDTVFIKKELYTKVEVKTERRSFLSRLKRYYNRKLKKQN